VGQGVHAVAKTRGRPMMGKRRFTDKSSDLSGCGFSRRKRLWRDDPGVLLQSAQLGKGRHEKTQTSHRKSRPMTPAKEAAQTERGSIRANRPHTAPLSPPLAVPFRYGSQEQEEFRRHCVSAACDEAVVRQEEEWANGSRNVGTDMGSRTGHVRRSNLVSLAKTK
jgi:hypothetical protein